MGRGPGEGRAPFLRGAGALPPAAPGAPDALADLRAAGEAAPSAAGEVVAGRLAAPGDAAPLVPAAGLGAAAPALPSGFATGAGRRLGGEVSTAGGGLIG